MARSTRALTSPLSLLAGIALLSANTATAAPVIYEPFADSNATLTGNASGTGLSGTWTGSAAVVSATPLSWGQLAAPSGNEVTANNQNGVVSVGTTLSSAGLLDDNTSLWFSVLVRSGSDVATNGDLGFVLGTDGINSGNNLPLSGTATSSALGFRMKNNQLRAAQWLTSGITQSAGSSIAPDTLYLVVGKFIWGSTTDTLEIYKADTGLALTLSSTFTTSTNLDQSQFDTISFGTKSATNAHRFDEIRFGATQADVLPVPEPSSLAFVALGTTALLRRRRAARYVRRVGA